VRPEKLLRDVDGVLVLSVAGDVLEDIHRLQGFSERPAALAQHLVLAGADARRVLVPESVSRYPTVPAT